MKIKQQINRVLGDANTTGSRHLKVIRWLTAAASKKPNGNTQDQILEFSAVQDAGRCEGEPQAKASSVSCEYWKGSPLRCGDVLQGLQGLRAVSPDHPRAGQWQRTPEPMRDTKHPNISERKLGTRPEALMVVPKCKMRKV